MADTVRDNRATVDPFSQPLEGNIVESPDLFEAVDAIRHGGMGGTTGVTF